MYSIYKKDISAYFNTLTGYLVIGIFLLVSGLLLWVFPDTSILEYGYATLESFFAIAPYLFMFLIPSITMRSIAGEKASGTFELLLSKPITVTQLVAAKYLASLTVVMLTLLPTLIYYFSVYQLSNPLGNVDTGAVAGSYIGLLLLGSAFTAIGTCTSALTQNPIVAFLLAVFICFIGFYAFDAISSLSVFYAIEHLISGIGMQSHYEAISRGVLDSQDFVYFISIVLLFLFITYLSVVSPFQKRTKTLSNAGIAFVIVVLANFLADLSFARIDFTEDKRHTLSDVSRQTATAITDDIYVTVFLEGTLPSNFTRLRRSTAQLMSDLKRYAGGRIKYSFVDPLVEANATQQEEITAILFEKGIQPTDLSVRTSAGLTQKRIFPYALVQYGEDEIPVSLLQNRMGTSPEEVLNNSVQNLEYAFVSAIRKVVSGGKPLIGFTEGHGELNDLELYDAMHSLTSGYDVGRLDLSEISFEGLKNIDVIVVAKPTQPFSEADKFKLDYFTMHGGRLIWAIDQTTASMDSIGQSGYQLAIAQLLNLDDQLFTYGIRFNYDLLGDLNAAQIPMTVGQIGGQSQIELVPWLFYPIFMPLSSHPIVRNIDGIRSEFAGTLDTIATAGIQKEFILHSSPFSRTLQLPASIGLSMIEDMPDPAEFRDQPKPVAALLSGSFNSVFTGRPHPEGIPLEVQVPSKSVNTKMLAIADGDVFKNQINQADGTPFQLGWDRYMNQQFGNRSFLSNAVDYLTGDDSMISLRQKEVKLRLLDMIKIKEDKFFWQFLNVGLPPILLLAFGFIQHYIRKRKYGKQMTELNS